MKLSKQKRVTKYIVALVTLGIVLLIGFIMKSQPVSAELLTDYQMQIFESQNEMVVSSTALPINGIRYEVNAAHASAEVKVVEVAVEATSTQNSTTAPALDRTKPIYKVYKDGYYVEVPAEWQWYIRDIAEEYDFDEKIIFGCIIAESCFDPNCKGDSERSLGLAQINRYWITKANIPHFTDDYQDRNLLDPYDNILTLTEIWSYARDAYNLDISTELGMKRLLYWHNTGKNPSKVTQWNYSDNCFKYASELVLIQK